MTHGIKYPIVTSTSAESCEYSPGPEERKQKRKEEVASRKEWSRYDEALGKLSNKIDGLKEDTKESIEVLREEALENLQIGRRQIEDTLQKHKEILLFETYNRILQALNDDIMDVNRSPSSIAGVIVLTQQEKSLLKQRNLGYITHILSAASNLDFDAQHALECLTADQVSLAMICADRLFLPRNNGNNSQHPQPSRAQSIELLRNPPASFPLESDSVRQSLEDFINTSPTRLPLPGETGRTNLFSEETEETTCSLQETLTNLQNRMNRLQQPPAEVEEEPSSKKRKLGETI